MNNLKYILILLICLSAKKTTAQQDPQRTFYNYQMNLINPAYSGADDFVEITLGVRSQWAGVQGAPESQSIIASAPLGKNLGLGISILNDKTFIEKQTSVAIDFGYNVSLNKNVDLFLGLKASGNSYNINTEGLITYGVGQDGSLMDFNNRFTPNIGVGAYLKHDKYFVSLSAPKLLSNERLTEENGVATLNSGKQHFYIAAGYKLKLGSNINLQLSSLYRYVAASPSSIDITGVFDFGNRFNLGVSYRVDAAIAGIFMFNVSDGFKLGYAYETATNSQINGLENASHELFMRVQL
ncbi:MAG: type IX secretion system membrane protein PorP/SprF [Maribacter sp.]